MKRGNILPIIFIVIIFLAGCGFLLFLHTNFHNVDIHYINSDNFSYCSNPSWSPDENTIVFYCMQYSLPCNCGGSLCYDIKTTGLYTASPEDTIPHPFIKGALDPAWSPTDNLIAFLTISNASSDVIQTDLAISRSNGTAVQSITRNGSVDSFSWSPDGKFLAYRILGRISISQKNVSADTTALNFVEYWIYSVNETKNTFLGRYYYQLSPTTEKLSPIYWSSSGDRIIIFNGTLNRWEIPVNKTPAENIISDSHKSWLTIDYNPGKNLAVFSTYNRQVFLFNISTNETIPLAPEDSCTGVAWKPDGTIISCSNETQIRLINPDMSQPSMKTMNLTTPSQPLMKEMTWGPDGTQLLFEQRISSTQCTPQYVSRDIFWDPPITHLPVNDTRKQDSNAELVITTSAIRIGILSINENGFCQFFRGCDLVDVGN